MIEDNINELEPSSDSVRRADPLLCKEQDCQLEASGVCRICHQPFCILHQSDLDETVCQGCPLSTEVEAAIAEQELPLVDENGVRHKGRDIFPTGEAFQTSAKMIGDMSSDELRNHVIKYKALLRQAELLTDFRRVQLSMAQMEVIQRDEIERRRLRGIRQSTTTQGIKVGAVEMKQMGDKSWAVIASKLKKAGITKEMLEAALRAKQRN